MITLFLIAFPFAVCAIIYCVQVSFQKKDFKKYRRNGESYDRFCKRYYTRYL